MSDVKELIAEARRLREASTFQGASVGQCRFCFYGSPDSTEELSADGECMDHFTQRREMRQLALFPALLDHIDTLTAERDAALTDVRTMQAALAEEHGFTQLAQAERDAALAKCDDVVAFTVDLIGHACESHSAQIREMSFPEFQKAMPKTCQWCREAKVTALEARWDKAKEMVLARRLRHHDQARSNRENGIAAIADQCAQVAMEQTYSDMAALEDHSE